MDLNSSGDHVSHSFAASPAAKKAARANKNLEKCKNDMCHGSHREGTVQNKRQGELILISDASKEPKTWQAPHFLTH